MDWKVRALTAALMTIIMVAIVTFVATWLALGFDPGFLRQWAKAFVVAWPIAAMTGFLVMPVARRLAESGQTREELAAAVDACYKLIRLTIDEARAEEFRKAAKDLLSRAG